MPPDGAECYLSLDYWVFDANVRRIKEMNFKIFIEGIDLDIRFRRRDLSG